MSSYFSDLAVGLLYSCRVPKDTMWTIWTATMYFCTSAQGSHTALRRTRKDLLRIRSQLSKVSRKRIPFSVSDCNHCHYGMGFNVRRTINLIHPPCNQCSMYLSPNALDYATTPPPSRTTRMKTISIPHLAEIVIWTHFQPSANRFHSPVIMGKL